jgi:hypothetical protein
LKWNENTNEELAVYEQSYIKKIDLNWNPTPKEFRIVMEE